MILSAMRFPASKARCSPTIMATANPPAGHAATNADVLASIEVQHLL